MYESTSVAEYTYDSVAAVQNILFHTINILPVLPIIVLLTTCTDTTFTHIPATRAHIITSHSITSTFDPSHQKSWCIEQHYPSLNRLPPTYQLEPHFTLHARSVSKFSISPTPHPTPLLHTPIHLKTQLTDQKTNGKKHNVTQIFHFATGLTFAIANQNMPQLVWRPFSVFLFLLVFTVETLRIRSPKGSLNRLIVYTFRPFMRSHETRQFAGIAYYTFGVTVASTCFPRPCATLAILALASLDPVAAFAGSFFQSSLPSLRLRHGKSIAGLLCASLACASFLFVIIAQAAYSTLKSPDVWMVAVIIASVGSLVEFCTPSPQIVIGTPRFPLAIDDNALIPIVCAVAARWVLRVTYNTVELSPLLLLRSSPA